MSNFSFYSPIQKGYQSHNHHHHHHHHSHSLGSVSQTLLSASANRSLSPGGNISNSSSSNNSSRCSTSSSSVYSSILQSPTSSTNDEYFFSSTPTAIISSSACCPSGVCSLVNNHIQLRFLNPGDYDIVKQLCEEWFPVEYPAKWFEAITSDTNLFSLAASLDGKIIGLIVAELKPGKDLNREDRDILCESQLRYTAAYILSLGVVDSSRRQGIASLLLSSLLNHLSTLQCKAVFLHVLTSNEPALKFYEKHRFRVHKFLPYYYSIGGRARDGFTYVLYLNGGHGPWGLQEYVQHFCEVTMRELCSFPQWCMYQVRRIAHSIITFVR